MANGGYKLVQDLCVGDSVATLLNQNDGDCENIFGTPTFARTTTTTVIAITKDEINGMWPMIDVGCLSLTPSHPIRVNRYLNPEQDYHSLSYTYEHSGGGTGEKSDAIHNDEIIIHQKSLTLSRCWVRPIDHYPVNLRYVTALYNFVLESRSSLIVDGIEVCTLGQFCEGIDDMDSFFGSERVVQEIC